MLSLCKKILKNKLIFLNFVDKAPMLECESWFARERTMQMLLMTMLLIFVVSCGVDDFSARSPSAQGSFGGEVRPPADYYRALLVARFHQRHDNSADTHNKVFLNFGGGEIVRGFGKNESFLPCNKSAVISPAQLNIKTQESIYDELADFFNAEDAHLDLVLDEPLSGDYSTVHIGGWPHALGCREQALLGSAPSDRGNVNPADVGFVFNTDEELMPAAIAHVIGRMLGLPVQNQADDTIMARHIDTHTPLVLNEQARQTLHNQRRAAARVANDDLPGQVFVHAIGSVLDDIDPDEEVDIRPIQAELRLIVPDEIKLPGLERALTAIYMLGLESGDFKKNGNWNKVRDALTSVFKKAIAKSIKNPRDVSGNVSSSVADVLGNAWGKNKTNNTEEQRITELPDISALLELDALTDSAQLFPLLDAQRQMIDHNFNKMESSSLQSLLKVGYFQRIYELH